MHATRVQETHSHVIVQLVVRFCLDFCSLLSLVAAWLAVCVRVRRARVVVLSVGMVLLAEAIQCAHHCSCWLSTSGARQPALSGAGLHTRSPPCAAPLAGTSENLFPHPALGRVLSLLYGPLFGALLALFGAASPF